MLNKWRKYSYAAQKSQRHQIRRVLIWLGSFFIVYTIITSLFFSVVVLENEAMLPGLSSGDRFIFSSYAVYRMFPGKTGVNRDPPFRRGNIVLVDKSLTSGRGFFITALDRVVRFFTIQQVSLAGREEHLFIKRAIGLPGDEVSMTKFVLRVKPAGGSYELTEFELSERPYDIAIPQVPALWDESIPFSGNMDPIILRDNECFLLSDDRSNTNDSRTWGPVTMDLIVGKALFRFWPFTRVGGP
ncbi:MAG: signal peptidase I [Spirochaetaceae bacterium]|jgi:signal peptidase I|nr:signal peptidase I [Spirochaetaceae bacterium]